MEKWDKEVQTFLFGLFWAEFVQAEEGQGFAEPGVHMQ